MVSLMNAGAPGEEFDLPPGGGNILGALLGAFRLIANTCNLVTNLLNTTALTYMSQVYTMGKDMVNIFADIGNTQKIAADGAALGEALFQYSVGFQFPAVQNLAQDVGAA